MLTDEQIKTKAKEIHRDTQYFEKEVTASLIKIAKWARAESQTVPTPSDELLDNCWRSACEFSLAAIRGGDFDSKKAFKEWLRSSTDRE